MDKLPGRFIVLGLFCGLTWWGLIQGGIWVSSNISLGWIA